MLFSIQYWGHNLKSRILLSALCICTIALVYSTDVVAASNFALRYYIAGHYAPTALDAVTFKVVPDNKSFYYGSDSGNYTGAVYWSVFDLCIPVSLVADDPSALPASCLLRFSALPLFYVRLSNNYTDISKLSFLDAYIDSHGQDVFYVYSLDTPQNPQFGDIIDKSIFYRFGVSLRFNDYNYSRYTSQSFDLHLRFTAITGSSYSSSDVFVNSSPVFFDVYTNYVSNLNDSYIVSDDAASTNELLDDINDTLIDQRDEDRDDAGKAGDDASGLVSDMESGIKSKWEILWYPIKFTQQVLQVFTGGTASAYYQSEYGYVTGYTYNDETGCLDPVIDRSRASPRSGGSVITWPAFELMGMQIWDSYDFDLAQIKSYFPALFDALYVGVSILELYWFVGFLRDKYEEVFGG